MKKLKLIILTTFLLVLGMNQLFCKSDKKENITLVNGRKFDWTPGNAERAYEIRKFASREKTKEMQKQLKSGRVLAEITDNGVTDARVYEMANTQHTGDTSSRGMYAEWSNTVVEKKGKFYLMPRGINELLKDEGTIIDSSNALKIVERFIRYNCNGDVKFEKIEFIKKNQKREEYVDGRRIIYGDYYNIRAKTSSTINDMYWYIAIDFSKGKIIGFGMQYIRNRSKKRYPLFNINENSISYLKNIENTEINNSDGVRVDFDQVLAFNSGGTKL